MAQDTEIATGKSRFCLSQGGCGEASPFSVSGECCKPLGEAFSAAICQLFTGIYLQIQGNSIQVGLNLEVISSPEELNWL